MLPSDGIENAKLYFKMYCFAHHRRDEGEAKRVEPLQRAPAISSISIGPQLSQDNANYTWTAQQFFSCHFSAKMERDG